ncbi:GGDEF domain-containing protein [Teredinibacter turnerae]|uniref:GGDEF domain-containing protein n=1 Tax=Teredinibacter turnerae TaxID=2426 RepID=UPI0003779857|nr:GGDEF domain-containing protein [Teredinibacter turnerae]
MQATRLKNLHTLSRFDATLGLLALLSIICVLIPKDLVTRKLEIHPSNFQANIAGDSYSGGKSEASWVDEKTRRWRCILRDAIYAPYCSFQISTINENWRGLDLRAFNKMTIVGEYLGEANYIRVYLRNRHPRYYVLGDETTTKYNQAEVPIADLRDGVNFRLQDFEVADWWLVQKKIPLKDSHPEFNDVIYIEFQTSSELHSGTHEIQIEKIIWQGNYISNETLYRGIALVWAATIFLLLLLRLTRLKAELESTRNYQHELESINKLLNLQNKQFEDLAKTDQLTGLLNRIGIREPLLAGLNAWKHTQTPMAFVLIDLDYFKMVNDRYGHDVGDQVLRKSAELIRSNVRESDYVARWGGEEFLLMLPDTSLTQAEQIAEMLRSKLEAANIHTATNITASFGVAALKEDNLDNLFKAADDALYKAKQNGRNCVYTNG